MVAGAPERSFAGDRVTWASGSHATGTKPGAIAGGVRALELRQYQVSLAGDCGVEGF